MTPSGPSEVALAISQVPPGNSSKPAPLRGGLNSGVRAHMKYFCASSVFLTALILSGCGTSEYSHCVQVAKTSDFTGDWLLASQTLSDRTVRTEDCVALDRSDDLGDGPREGTVRWAECRLGPDCNEAGEF